MKIVEAYVGEYASGKSENAVNRALELIEKGRKVTLVDLDLVEPFYTLRPLKKMLENKGIEVIAWETKETFGLGEAGYVLKPQMRWALRREGDVIFDVGYGIQGIKIFNLVEGLWEDKDLKVYVVVNISRPLTSSVEDIVSYLHSFKKVDGLINNSHLGEQTDLDIIEEGAHIVGEVSCITQVPVIASTMEKNFAALVGSELFMGYPVRYIERYMPQTFW